MADLAPPEPLCVLIVDDCQDTTTSLALLARLWGYRAHTARDGGEALRLAGLYRPNVVLLDIGMPGMDGWEVARRLREMPGLDGTFLVVVSGYDRADDLRRSHEAGCDLHLTKPVHPDRLRELLAACEKGKDT